ncbi:hypothetical protein Aperf_G00000133044 [Anoplocephala perfoliata]
MGSSESTLKGSTSGYHILKVQDGSPGQKAGLEAFFDFIVSVGGLRLEQDNETIKDVLARYKDKPVLLQVYSSKTQQYRDVTLIPTDDWGGQGLLGLSIRYCSFKSANENVWHVLDVHPGSPAAMAGLQPFTDYVIGTDALMNDSGDFFSVVETHNGQPLRLYVYNSVTDQCRDVTLIPNLSWGGDGMLGCEIGFGYLHQIPRLQQPSSPPIATNQVLKPTPSSQQQAMEHRQQNESPPCDPAYPAYPTPSSMASYPPASETMANGAPPQPPPIYTPSVDTINGVPLAPPAPLPSNLFEGIHLTPPTTPPAFVLPSADVAMPAEPPPPLLNPSGPPVEKPQQQIPPPPLQQPQKQTLSIPPPVEPTIQSVPLYPTTNIAPPGMPPIAVQMPPTTDLLTGQTWPK